MASLMASVTMLALILLKSNYQHHFDLPLQIDVCSVKVRCNLRAAAATLGEA
jgi:hypothetical protein